MTWYATERGEVRFNVPSPSVFELTSPETDRWGSWNTGQSYLHAVTQNWLDEEGNVGHWVARSEEVEKEEGAKWLAEAFSAESRTFSSEEIGKRIFSSWTGVGVTRCV